MLIEIQLDHDLEHCNIVNLGQGDGQSFSAVMQILGLRLAFFARAQKDDRSIAYSDGALYDEKILSDLLEYEVLARVNW
jgi:hypothetical protein